MKTLFAMAVALAMLTGCANTDAIKARADIQAARSAESVAYTEAVKTLAQGAGDGPRLAALMLMFSQQQRLAAPAVLEREPGLVDYGLRLLELALGWKRSDDARDVAIRASDNARDVSLGSYGALADTAALIQAPAATQTTQTWTTLEQTASGAGASVGGQGGFSTAEIGGGGVIGGGSYTASPQSISGSYNPASSITYPISP